MPSVLQAVVEPYFKQSGITHQWKHDTLHFHGILPECNVVGMVMEIPDSGVLTIWIFNIVRFPEFDNYSYVLANLLNQRGAGKFCVDEKNRMDYGLDITQVTTEAEFDKAFQMATFEVSRNYETLMKVRYCGLTWDAAQKKKVVLKDQSRRDANVDRMIREALEES